MGTFRPRSTLVEMFSTFIQLDADRFDRWISDIRLRHSIQRCVKAGSDDPNLDQFWALHWHRHWEQHSHPLALSHLQAYCQEPAYWAAHQVVQKYTLPGYGWPEYFQVVNLFIQKALSSFDASKGGKFKSFVGVVFLNALRDWLRCRQEVDLSTPWAFLRKVSKQKLLEALQDKGLSSPQIEQYAVAWKCFKELYVPKQVRGTAKLPEPDAALWDEIAHLYTTEQRANPAVNGATMQKWLQETEAIARRYLYPTMTSLTRTIGEDAGTELDLPDPNLPPLEHLLVDEAIAQRQTQRTQLQAVLVELLGQLGAEEQVIVSHYYREGLTQQQIAQQLAISQPKVARRLKKARQQLLEGLLDWGQHQEGVNKPMSVNQVQDGDQLLEEWLKIHYSSPVSSPVS